MPNRTLIAAVLASLLPAVASAQSSSTDQGRLVAAFAGQRTQHYFTKFAGKAGLGSEYGLRSACTRYGTAEGLQYPQGNIEYGTKYFGTLLAAYKGDVQAAIAAYNSGSGHRFIADAVNNGFCIARQNGVCIAWYKFEKGEVGNQPYVASVLVFARKYGSTEPVPAVRGRLITKGATPAPVVSGCSCRARV
jgi:hypothetical protein